MSAFSTRAQGTAARHHDATGHATWCDIAMSVRYGQDTPNPRQIDIEDSIAASSANSSATSSGGQPETAPLTDLDAPAVAPAGERKPEGRSVERCARGRKPEPAYV